MSLFYLKVRNIFYICHLIDLLSFTLKSEADTSFENNIVRKRADQAVLGLVKHVQMN